MNIQLLFGADPRELRNNLINSKFFYSDFDPFIIGVETNSGSIIYNIEEVIKFMIQTENPQAFDYDEYEDFEYVYDLTFNKLVTTNGQIGIDELKSMVEFNNEHSSQNNPYTFCWLEELKGLINGEINTH